MPELSLEFWLGSILAIITLILGLGVTLAMDAKTKGEFRFAVGCFLVSALSVIYGIEMWQISTTWSTRSRLLLVYGLIAIIVACTGEVIRWSHTRHQHAVGEFSASFRSRFCAVS